MPVKGKTNQVPSSLSYMIVIQNDLVMADCFRLRKFTIDDGHLSLWKLDSEGNVIELINGTLLDGEFRVAKERRNELGE